MPRKTENITPHLWIFFFPGKKHPICFKGGFIFLLVLMDMLQQLEKEQLNVIATCTKVP